MPIKYNDAEFNIEYDLYAGSDLVFQRPRRGVPITYWWHWYRSPLATANAQDVSIAARKNKTDSERVFISYVTASGQLVVMSADVKQYAYNMEWVQEESISGCVKCALAFDGQFVEKRSTNTVVFDTETLPWLFYTTDSGALYGGVLGGPYSVIVADNVESMDAVRGIHDARHEEDMGLLVFYVIDGDVYYRPRLNGAWQDQETVPDLPSDIVNISVDRTFDWRIVLQLEDDEGDLYEAFSMPYYSGWVGVEYLKAEITDFTVDVYDIQYLDLQSGDEYIAVDVSTLVTVLGAISPILYSAKNFPVEVYDEEEEDWVGNWGLWLSVKWTDQVPNIGDNLSYIEITDTKGTVWPAQEVVIDPDFPNRMLFRFNDFNNAVNPVTLSYAGGDLTSGVVAVDPTSVQFVATNLVPTTLPIPQVVDIWNVSKQAIIIEFDMPIISIDSQEGFLVTGLEPYYSPDGHLVPTEYEVDSITTEDVAEPNPNRIQINLTYDGRMKHAQGLVTVDFTGSLMGPGGMAVEPFVETFTPSEPALKPFWFNPGDLNTIAVSIPVFTVTTNDVAYYELQSTGPDNHLTAGVSTMTVVVTKVGELPL